MLNSSQQPLSNEGQWQTIVKFSLRGEAGCELQAAKMISEILVSVHISDRNIVEAKQAVSSVMEKEMLYRVADQIQRIFTIQIQLSQSVESLAKEADQSEAHSRSRGCGFFLTEKRISDTQLGNAMNNIVINVHFYHEGRPA